MFESLDKYFLEALGYLARILAIFEYIHTMPFAFISECRNQVYSWSNIRINDSMRWGFN